MQTYSAMIVSVGKCLSKMTRDSVSCGYEGKRKETVLEQHTRDEAMGNELLCRMMSRHVEQRP